MTKSPQLRGVRMRSAVVDATVDLIASKGIDQVRVSDVAVKAGVNESSIYRTWATRSGLLADALLSRIDDEVRLPDTGDVTTDLEQFVKALGDFLESPLGHALVRTTLVAGDDVEVADARARFWEARIDAAAEIVTRGQRTGAVRPDADAQMVILLLGGLAHLYVTHLGRPIPDDLPARAVSLLSPGLTRG